MHFKNITRDICSLKIQGAENIAKHSLIALRELAHTSNSTTPKAFLNELEEGVKILIKTRPTEPCMRNALNFSLYDLRGREMMDLAAIKRKLTIKISYALEHLRASSDKIAEIGARKIHDGMIIYTHCHSSTVVGILKKAKENGINFEVHNTETRPKLQGRITAAELAKHGIKVKHYVDSAARIALKNADFMLIGADAITTEGNVINKIGSELISEAADKMEIPVYCCSDSWKFDPLTVFGYEEEIEKRADSEIWQNPPKNVKISNPAFEKINPELISGLITELGIFKPSVFVEELKHRHPWMFE